jgi:uncharacterized protein YsxB (DUF464 family)
VIEIKLALDGAGLLRGCDIQGHGGANGGGADVVCAAVSVLIRTALRVLTGRPGITIRGEAPERGSLWMEAEYTPEGRDFLSATGFFLTEGLKSVAADYPGHCKMTIYTNSMERRN